LTSSLSNEGNGYFVAKTMTDGKSIELISGNLDGKPLNKSRRNRFFSAFLIPFGVGCCFAKLSFNASCGKLLFIN